MYRRSSVIRVEVPADVDDAWAWALALPYRWLSNPGTALIMPASPDSIPDDYDNWARRHRQQLAYYTTLQSFLTYSFGWTRHDKGLLWWYANGFPTEDQRLALVDNVWRRDDTLTGYLAWVLARMEDSPDQSLNLLRPWATNPDLTPAFVAPKWERELRESLQSGVWAGGYDPMHIWGGVHGGAPSGARVLDGLSSTTAANARLLGVNEPERTATLVAETIDGWYARLAEFGEDLPASPNDASWRIDVFVKTMGYLGTYRRSRVTGLWFTGRHRFHTVGN